MKHAQNDSGTAKPCRKRYQTAWRLTCWLLALTLLAGALWLGRSAVGPLLAVVAGYSAAMLCAMRSLRGVSGDLAGYALCVGELCGLAAMSIF